MLLILSCIINFASLSFPISTGTCSRYGIEHVLFCYWLPVRNTSCDFSLFQAFVFFNRLRAIGVLIIIIIIMRVFIWHEANSNQIRYTVQENKYVFKCLANVGAVSDLVYVSLA